MFLVLETIKMKNVRLFALSLLEMLNILFSWEEGWNITEKGKIERREA